MTTVDGPESAVVVGVVFGVKLCARFSVRLYTLARRRSQAEYKLPALGIGAVAASGKLVVAARTDRRAPFDLMVTVRSRMGCVRKYERRDAEGLVVLYYTIRFADEIDNDCRVGPSCFFAKLLINSVKG